MADAAAAENVDLLFDFEELLFSPRSKSSSVDCFSTSSPCLLSLLSAATVVSEDDRSLVDCLLFAPRGTKKLARFPSIFAASFAASFEA